MPKLHRSSKISDYRFRRVLEQFVRDATATEAAKSTGLSVNSVHSIYRKLRVFFYEVGAFVDYYGGADPVAYRSEDPVFEQQLLAFHLGRFGRRRGLRSPSNEPPYHFAESCWRYDFKVLMDERPADAVYGMMQRHLIALIRLCGPVGLPPRNREAGARLVLQHANERIAWLMRNAPGYRSETLRTALAEALAIDDTI